MAQHIKIIIFNEGLVPKKFKQTERGQQKQ